VDHRNTERLSSLGTQLGSRFSMARSCVIEALADVQITAVCLYSAASAQLTTPGHGYNADMTQQDGTTGRAMFSAVER
jgi:hypothetical protein